MTRIIPVCLAAAAAGCVFNRVEIPLGGSLRAYDEKTVSAEPRAEGKIAMIDLEGILTSDHHESIFGIKEPAAAAFVEKLKKAEEDPGVKAVIVRIDSPGGDVTTSDILHNELKSFKERTRRPAVACFMGLATSGGYYVAGACDRIVAHPTSITGSIGVIALHVPLSGLMDKIGVKATALKSGARKDAGSPFRDLTEEDRGLLQSLVDQAHERFIRVVAEGRRGRLMEAEVRAAADGRVFTARQALDQARRPGGVPQGRAGGGQVAGRHQGGRASDVLSQAAEDGEPLLRQRLEHRRAGLGARDGAPPPGVPPLLHLGTLRAGPLRTRGGSHPPEQVKEPAVQLVAVPVLVLRVRPA